MRPALLRALHNDPLDQWARGALHAWDFRRSIVRFNGQRPGRFRDTPGFAFTRASSAVDYAQTAGGKWTPFAPGVPRITDRGLLIEGARTNLLLYARDFTQTDWTKTNVTAALTQTGILGEANSASLLTATSNAGTALQAVTSASAARSVTCFVKRVTGTGTIEFTADGGSTWTDITASLTTAEFFRAEIRQTVTNPSVGFRLGTSGDAIAVDFAQLESAAAPSSPILTTTASATRAADAAIITAASSYPQTIFAEFALNTSVTSAIQGIMQMDDGGTTNRMALFKNGSGDLGFANYTLAGSATNFGLTGDAVAMTAGAVFKMALRMLAGDTNYAQNGVLATTSAAAGLPAAGSRILFGSSTAGGGGTLYGYMRRAAVYQRALTDNELRDLTR